MDGRGGVTVRRWTFQGQGRTIHAPNAKRLAFRKSSRSARGVAGVIVVYGSDDDRLNLVINCDTGAFLNAVKDEYGRTVDGE